MPNEIVIQIEVAVSEIGLRINFNKTKYMTNRINASNKQINHILISGQNYEEVDNFKYLGNLITSHNIKDGVRDKLATGNRYLRALNNTLHQGISPRKQKLLFIKWL